MQSPAEYELYMASPEWEQLRVTHPDKPICIACDSKYYLQMHHMRYPENIWDTEHKHCCWLCVRCHETFHRGLTAGRNQGYKMVCFLDECLKDFTKAVIRVQVANESSQSILAYFQDMSPHKLSTWFQRDNRVRQRRRL